MGKSIKAASKDTNWHSQKDTPTMEEIQLGAILRIATSLEKLEEPYELIIAERDSYKRLLEEAKFDISQLKSLVRSGKKQIAKLKAAQEVEMTGRVSAPEIKIN